MAAGVAPAGLHTAATPHTAGADAADARLIDTAKRPHVMG